MRNRNITVETADSTLLAVLEGSEGIVPSLWDKLMLYLERAITFSQSSPAAGRVRTGLPATSQAQHLKSILITGAASGIGRALALRLAGPGITLHLSDVDGEGLQATAAACEKLKANCALSVIDVRDASTLRTWMESSGQLDLVLACAGVQYTSLVARAETADETLRTVEINLIGALNTALPALDIMGRQCPAPDGTRGQIAIIASQGAFVSVPGASAYCASKAAVDSWAVGRSVHARGQGIFITSICPGYVRTNMTKINDFPMHGMMEPAEAAAIIVRELAKKPVRLVFPKRMYLAARFGGMLPAGFPAQMLARNNARKEARRPKA